MPDILEAPAPGADLSLLPDSTSVTAPPAPQPAAAPPPPAWSEISTHSDFQALPQSKKLQVANVYADSVRDHALTLPGADPAAVNASVDEWRKQQTAAIAPPANPAPEGSPEYQAQMRQGVVPAEQQKPVGLAQAWKEGGIFGVLAENPALVPSAAVRAVTQLNPLTAPITLAEEALPGVAGRIVKGANEGAADLVSGLTTPANIALLGTGFLGKTAQRLISAGFSADMLSHVPEQVKAIGDAPDAREAAKRTVGLIGNLVFGTAAGAHAVKGGVQPITQEQLDAVGTVPDATIETAASDRGFAESHPEQHAAVLREAEKRGLTPAAKAPDQAVQILAGDPDFAKAHPEEHAAAVREAKRRGLEPITDPQHVVAAQDASDSTLEQAVASPEVAGHPSVLAAAKAELEHRAAERVSGASDQALQIAAGDSEWSQQAPVQHGAVVDELKRRGLEPVAAEDVSAARQKVIDFDKQAQDARDAGLDQTAAELLKQRDAVVSELKAKATPRVVDTGVDSASSQPSAALVDSEKQSPEWIKKNQSALAAVAEKSGVADKIEELHAQRFTAGQIATQLGVDVSMVRAVRASRGLPERTDAVNIGFAGGTNAPENPEFTKWADAKNAPETPKEVTQNGISEKRQSDNQSPETRQEGQVLSESGGGKTEPASSTPETGLRPRPYAEENAGNVEQMFRAKNAARIEAAKADPTQRAALNEEYRQFKVDHQKEVDRRRKELGAANAAAFLKDPRGLLAQLKSEAQSAFDYGEIAQHYGIAEIVKVKKLGKGTLTHKGTTAEGTVSPAEITVKIGDRTFTTETGIRFRDRYAQREAQNFAVKEALNQLAKEAPSETISPAVSENASASVTKESRPAPSQDLAAKAAAHFDRLTAIARARNAPDAEVAASDAIQSVVGYNPKIENDEHLGALLSRSLAQQVAEQHTREGRLKRGGGEAKVSLQEPVGEGSGSVADTVGDSYKDTTQYKTAVDAVLSATQDAITKFAEGDATKAEAASLVLKEQGFSNSEGGRPSNAAKTLAADPAFKASVQKGVLARIAADIKSRFDESVLDSTRLTNNDDAVNQAISNVTNLFQPGKLDRLGKVARGWFGAIAGRTLPRFTVADRDVGEKGARYISSKIAAEPLAGVYASKVLEGLPVDAKKLGAALTEDNLRSVREQNLTKAAEAEKAGDEKQAAEYRDRADNTASMIGPKKPFQDEAAYQSFLADPNTQTAIARHKQLWDDQIDPMYKKAQGIDPDEELPPRGLQTGARINLFALQDGDKGVARVSGSPSGGLTNTFKRKSPFATEAKGTASNYETAYGEIIKNTFGRQLDIANYNDFVGGMVDKGIAQIGKPGQHVEIDGENTVAFPLQRRVVIADGKSFSVSDNLYIRASLAPEFRSAVNVDPGGTSAIAKYVFRPINNAALYGLTDATVHVSNLATALFTRPAVAGGTLADTMLSAFGRADVPVTLTKAIVKGFQDNREQFAELASIGAARADAKSTTPLLGWSNKMIHVADKVTRLVLDDAYQSMVKSGLVEDTETNRREFVNQVGQYNRRAVTGLAKALKDAGISPFVTAGTTFNRLGLRTVGLQAGVEHTNALSHAITMTNVAMKWVGAAALIGATNYALTHDKGGGVLGRPGVPIGNIDTGQTDENDKPLSIPAADLIGLGRGLRATGVRGYAQAKRNGLTEGDARDSALRDVVNTAVSPFAGPGVRLGSAILFNRAPGIGTPPINHIVPPTGDETQKSQIAHNILKGLGDVNPGVAGYLDRQENPSLPTSDVVKRQLPRFTLRPSNSIDMMENYPQIVHKAQVNSFIEDTVYTARRLKPADRADYVQRQIDQIPPEDQKHLRDQLKRRKVSY